jgi:ABC-2 type transport system ATP-binding protein
MDAQTSFISLQNISKRYDTTLALDSISLDINRGEVFGYIGPNGAGKTTTIKILAGLIRDFEGDFIVNGQPVHHNFAGLQKIIGYMPQGVSFQEWRTVDSALKTFGELSGIPGEALEDKINQLLHLLHLTEGRYKKIIRLSGGMVQKVGLAQALLHDPQLLILDEPLNGLDPTSRFEVKKLIKELGGKGTTVFFSSHILSDVEDIADRIAIIDNGRILKLGETNSLTGSLLRDYAIEIVFFRECNASAVLNSVAGIAEITRQSPVRSTIRLLNEADKESVTSEILANLMAGGCPVQSFYRVIPNLDDVYLQYIKG